MPSTTRRGLLASVGGLLALAGCSGERRPQTTGPSDPEETTRRSMTTHPPQTDKPGWVGLEVENNDGVAHEVTVAVTPADGEVTSDEELFARTLTLRPQSEPEFNAVVPIPESGERRVRVAAEFAGADSADATDGTESADNDDGGSASATFTVSADAEYQRLFVTVDHDGALNLTQGTEPSEPIRTTSE